MINLFWWTCQRLQSHKFCDNQIWQEAILTWLLTGHKNHREACIETKICTCGKHIKSFHHLCGSFNSNASKTTDANKLHIGDKKESVWKYTWLESGQPIAITPNRKQYYWYGKCHCWNLPHQTSKLVLGLDSINLFILALVLLFALPLLLPTVHWHISLLLQ